MQTATSEEKKTVKRTRNLGAIVVERPSSSDKNGQWGAVVTDDGTIQPHFNTTASAMKWLSAQIVSGNVPGGRFRVVRVVRVFDTQSVQTVLFT